MNRTNIDCGGKDYLLDGVKHFNWPNESEG